MENIDTHICQVAIVALDARRLKQWYQDTFEFVDAGTTLFFPPISTRVQAISAFERISWLIDSQDYFNLEFFQFVRPASKARRSNHQVSDIGYSIMGIHVANFDAILDRAVAGGGRLIGNKQTGIGQQRACVQDPEGNVIELFERDPLEETGDPPTRPEVPSTVRSMTISVPDLKQARKTYVQGLGLVVLNDFKLHDREHEALWGLANADCKRLLLKGRNFLVELVQYIDPKPEPWPENYCISHQGYMNIAFGFHDKTSYSAALDRAVIFDVKPNAKSLDIGAAQVMYLTDPNGFSVEILHARKSFWSLTGYKPRSTFFARQFGCTRQVACKILKWLNGRASTKLKPGGNREKSNSATKTR